MIDNLEGRRVPLSEDELVDLVKAGNDFSVLEKTHYCPMSLLAGPLHLINHSCDHNAELQVMGERFAVKIVARRHIAKGDEITINYGSHYFGNKNKDCLCEPCQKDKGRAAAKRGDSKQTEPRTQTIADRGEDGKGRAALSVSFADVELQHCSKKKRTKTVYFEIPDTDPRPPMFSFAPPQVTKRLPDKTSKAEVANTSNTRLWPISVFTGPKPGLGLLPTVPRQPIELRTTLEGAAYIHRNYKLQWRYDGYGHLYL